VGALYVVVEGRRTEPKLYRAWLPLLLPEYQAVRRIEDARQKTYFVVAGEGYPSYKRRIRAAVKDVADPGSSFTHLMVCVDAEELACAERQRELQALVDSEGCVTPTRFIVANCCIESWLLGNRKVVRHTPGSAELRRLMALYNVRDHDPERMPNHGSHTRAVFHGEYLRAVFAERDLHFSKERPGLAGEPAYFAEMRKRTSESTDGVPHLASFAELLSLPQWIEATAQR